MERRNVKSNLNRVIVNILLALFKDQAASHPTDRKALQGAVQNESIL